jgi:hypothetical protein
LKILIYLIIMIRKKANFLPCCCNAGLQRLTFIPRAAAPRGAAEHLKRTVLQRSAQHSAEQYIMGSNGWKKNKDHQSSRIKKSWLQQGLKP